MMNWTADFPILAADENGNRLVYLDSAATTQHPMQVLNAVVDYYTKENANPHRGVASLIRKSPRPPPAAFTSWPCAPPTPTREPATP